MAFADLAAEILAELLERQPERATELGDHRYDDRLSDHRPAALAEQRRWADARLADLAALDPPQLHPQDAVDAEILANELRVLLLRLGEHSWNPLLGNPGRTLHTLLARDFAPLPDRLRSLAGRLREVPASLAAARATLGALPRVHVEVALDQFAGTLDLVGGGLDRYLDQAPAARGPVDAVRPAAVAALAEHRGWLAQRLVDLDRDGTFRDPRLGPDRYTGALSLVLQEAADPAAILARATADLDRVTAEMTELAGGRDVATVLAELGAAAAPDGATVLPLCRAAVAAQRAFVSSSGLVSDGGDPVETIAMPEFERGAATAYCDWPGPLETAPLPTFIAVSTTPGGWPPDRVAAYHREYNRHMLQLILTHEGFPGHALQLAHARRFTGSSAVRVACTSDLFVEGWATYAQQLMVDRGYPGEGDRTALRLHQLKLQLRWITNAIADIRVHCEHLAPAATAELVARYAFQGPVAAARRWRSAVLTPAQLPAYYLGNIGITDLAADLRADRPEWTDRQLHDGLLGHGSPAVRHVRTLLGLAPRPA
ncbi:MAG TPA: DUF885 domain-containing protein [Mycobacteriales bacterium]|nr:DUF885 domain-containing protein [Mycobacteriales bacterium]